VGLLFYFVLLNPVAESSRSFWGKLLGNIIDRRINSQPHLGGFDRGLLPSPSSDCFFSLTPSTAFHARESACVAGGCRVHWLRRAMTMYVEQTRPLR